MTLDEIERIIYAAIALNYHYYDHKKYYANSLFIVRIKEK